MNKTLIVLGLLVLGVMILFGCTQNGGNGTVTVEKVTSASDASKALNDASTDIAGINDSLGQIDSMLADTNSPSTK